jgi:hypothetical protein
MLSPMHATRVRLVLALSPTVPENTAIKVKDTIRTAMQTAKNFILLIFILPSLARIVEL